MLQNGYLASGYSDGIINIWQAIDGTLIRTLKGHTDSVYSLAVLQNDYLASGSLGEIKIWDTNDGSLIRTLTGHTKWVYSLAVLNNGYLASGSWMTQ